MSKAKRGLIIFIRNPEKGKVKTRLAKGVGEERALAIYKALLSKTRRVAQDIEAHRFLFYSEAVAHRDAWPSSDFDKRVQAGADLGARMEHAFEQALNEVERAVIVGSDIAQIEKSIIEKAFKILDNHDFVLGPALDGGYYLLGMKKPSPHLFQQMVWSTPDVATQTLKRIKDEGGSYGLVDTLSDIDYAEDWKKYGWEI